MSLGCAVCIHDMESPAFGFRSLELPVVGQPKFMGSQFREFLAFGCGWRPYCTISFKQLLGYNP